MTDWVKGKGENGHLSNWHHRTAWFTIQQTGNVFVHRHFQKFILTGSKMDTDALSKKPSYFWYFSWRTVLLQSIQEIGSIWHPLNWTLLLLIHLPISLLAVSQICEGDLGLRRMSVISIWYILLGWVENLKKKKKKWISGIFVMLASYKEKKIQTTASTTMNYVCSVRNQVHNQWCSKGNGGKHFLVSRP